MEQLSYSVAGIKNHTCKTQIKNALDKVKGVQQVGVDIGKSKVEVSYNEPATEIEIIDCINDAGFKII